MSGNSSSYRHVSVCMLAHNEEKVIGDTLKSILRQSIFRTGSQYSVRLYVVANGCADRTADVARDTLFLACDEKEIKFDWEVVDLSEPGKSRSWNTFVHDLAPKDSDFFIFCDADIHFPDCNTFVLLTQYLESHSDVLVATSTAVKSIENEKSFDPRNRLSVAVSKLWRKPATGSIAGSLYCIRTSLARRIVLPNGLLGEDGFLKISAATNFFSHSANFLLIRRAEGARHIFNPCRGIREYLLHERRLILGTFQNLAIREWIESRATGQSAKDMIYHLNQTDPQWSNRFLESKIKRLGMPGMIRAAWQTCHMNTQHIPVIKRALFFPLICARFFFMCAASVLAMRSVKTGRIHW